MILLTLLVMYSLSFTFFLYTHTLSLILSSNLYNAIFLSSENYGLFSSFLLISHDLTQKNPHTMLVNDVTIYKLTSIITWAKRLSFYLQESFTIITNFHYCSNNNILSESLELTILEDTTNFMNWNFDFIDSARYVQTLSSHLLLSPLFLIFNKIICTNSYCTMIIWTVKIKVCFLILHALFYYLITSLLKKRAEIEYNITHIIITLHNTL
jgi:hypothetical protein